MICYLNIMYHLANHLHPLQVENCDSNSRLVMDEDENEESGLKGLKSIPTHKE